MNARSRKRNTALICLLSAIILLLPFDLPRKLTTQADIDWLITTAADNNYEFNVKFEPRHKPRMKTFWEPIGETSPGDEAMLQLWKDEWKLAGFHPMVITLADAERHPLFEEMKEMVEAEFKDDPYNRYCFYRYLAMAATEGGWMSDYDTLPTNFPLKDGYKLPNKGKFTSFQAHVPSLISAKPGEWTRIAMLLVDAIPRTKNKVKSDMYSLLTLREEQDDGQKHGIVFLPPSWNVKAKFQYLAPHKIDCRDMAIGRAIHFSHSAVDGMYRKGVASVDTKDPFKDGYRAEAARAFMEEWRDQCGGSTEKK